MPELPTPHTDLASCRRSLCGGSRSFWVASQLLPRHISNAACGLYAFCREADDLIDEGSDPDHALVVLRSRLDAIYSQNPGDHPTDRVLSRVVARHGVPRALLDALLEGFHWDASGRRYASIEGFYEYAARVAGGIGVMMSLLMGVRDAQALARAADLGVAMQLTNICRDVGEDARAARLYLPTDLLTVHGIDSARFLAAPTFTPALGSVIQTLLDDADRLYARSESGIASLPRSCRPGIYAARRLYAAIGDRVRDLGYNAVDQRAILGGTGKLRLVAGTLRAMTLGESQLAAPALPACQFLVDAVLDAPKPVARWECDDAPWRAFGRRMLWMMQVFATLEERRAIAPSSDPQRS